MTKVSLHYYNKVKQIIRFYYVLYFINSPFKLIELLYIGGYKYQKAIHL